MRAFFPIGLRGKLSGVFTAQKALTPRLGTFMESLGISTDDVFTLFMLIDANHNGLVDLDEFVSGCMQCLGRKKIHPKGLVGWGETFSGKTYRRDKQTNKQTNKQTSKRNACSPWLGPG